MKVSRIGVSLSVLVFALFSLSASAAHHRYVTIDSGGMLGLIPATLLQNIEEETGKPMRELVDGFAGTSTGAIISSLLSVPAPNRDQPFTAKEAVEFYKIKGVPVFEAATTAAISNGIAKFFNGKMDFSASKILQGHLEQTFEGRSLADAKSHLIILAHNKLARQVQNFDSRGSNSDLRVSDLVLASSSIADVFGPHELRIDGNKQSFVDAGSMGLSSPLSDPTGELVKVIENEMKPTDTYVIYSLGTGFAAARKLNLPSNVRVVRIEPNVQHLAGNMLAMNLLAADTSPETIEAMIDVGLALKSSPEYQEMLQDLTAQQKQEL